MSNTKITRECLLNRACHAFDTATVQILEERETFQYQPLVWLKLSFETPSGEWIKDALVVHSSNLYKARRKMMRLLQNLSVISRQRLEEMAQQAISHSDDQQLMQLLYGCGVTFFVYR